MKKIVSILTVLAVATCGAAANQKFVAIDSLSIMQKSDEGKSIANEIQKKIENFQTEVKKTQELLQSDAKNAQKEITDMQSAFEKKMTLLSAEARITEQAKIEEKKHETERQFAQHKQELEHKLASKENVLRQTIQAKQIALREKQLGVIAKIYKDEPSTMVVEKQSLLFASSALDQTDKVLKAVNDAFTAEKNAKKVAKNDVKKASETKATAQVKAA